VSDHAPVLVPKSVATSAGAVEPDSESDEVVNSVSRQAGKKRARDEEDTEEGMAAKRDRPRLMRHQAGIRRAAAGPSTRRPGRLAAQS
jgi:hypothetical protein